MEDFIFNFIYIVAGIVAACSLVFIGYLWGLNSAKKIFQQVLEEDYQRQMKRHHSAHRREFQEQQTRQQIMKK